MTVCTELLVAGGAKVEDETAPTASADCAGGVTETDSVNGCPALAAFSGTTANDQEPLNSRTLPDTVWVGLLELATTASARVLSLSGLVAMLLEVPPKMLLEVPP